MFPSCRARHDTTAEMHTPPTSVHILFLFAEDPGPRSGGLSHGVLDA